MLAQKFELTTQMLSKYMSAVQQSSYAKQRLQLLRHRVVNASSAFFRKRQNPVNVAIVTDQGPNTSAVQMAHYTKVQYSRLHSYHFILDQSAPAAPHTRDASWNGYALCKGGGAQDDPKITKRKKTETCINMRHVYGQVLL